MIVSYLNVNKTLSKDGCWKMVNAIQKGKNPEDIKTRCNIAETWLKANVVISHDDFDELMMTVTWWYREANRIEREGA